MNEDFNYDYMKYQYGKEHLSNIFMTMVDQFQHIKDANVSGQINLYELFQRIKYNIVYDISVDTILTDKYVNGSENPDYNKIKYQLPTVTYNAKFDGYKDLNHLIEPTNLMFLDIDDFNSKEEAEAYKDHITLRYDWIVACHLSLSKLGLHIIIKVDVIIGNEDFNRKYDFISSEYFEGRLDKQGKSLTRYTVIPYDYNIYINETPNILNINHIINQEKGIRSGYKEDSIISTSYPFYSSSPLNATLNASARNGLKFKCEFDESIFSDPNIPHYISEGI